MLFTNFFCNIKYTARTGKIKIKQAAFFVEYCGYVSYTPIASIKFSSSYIFTERGKFFDINIIGSKYSFQCQTIAKIETVVNTTLDDGIDIEKKVLKRPAPSIHAASSSSLGKPLKNWI